MKTFFVLLFLISVAFATAWCGSDFCDRSYDCRIKVSAPEAGKFYSLNNLNFSGLLSQCSDSVNLDNKSFVAVKDNVQAPIYFQENASQENFLVAFKSDLGAGNYFIYFDSGSGRANSSSFTEPNFVEIQNCSAATVYTNANESCYSPTSEYTPGVLQDIPPGKIKLKYLLTILPWSNSFYFQIYVKNNEKTTNLYSGTFPASGPPKTYSGGAEVDAAYSSQFVITGFGSYPNLVFTEFRLWAASTIPLESFEVQEQSYFSVEMPEVFNRAAKIKIKNNGPEQISSLQVIPNVGEVLETSISLLPNEEKEISYFTDEPVGAYELSLALSFDSGGTQEIEKKILVYDKTERDVLSSCEVLENSSSCATSYFLDTELKNTFIDYDFISEEEICGKRRFTNGPLNCSERYESTQNLFVGAVEYENKTVLKFRNIFEFSISRFLWGYNNSLINGTISEMIQPNMYFNVTIDRETNSSEISFAPASGNPPPQQSNDRNYYPNSDPSTQKPDTGKKSSEPILRKVETIESKNTESQPAAPTGDATFDLTPVYVSLGVFGLLCIIGITYFVTKKYAKLF